MPIILDRGGVVSVRLPDLSATRLAPGRVRVGARTFLSGPVGPPSAVHGLLDYYHGDEMKMQPPGIEPRRAFAGGSPTAVLGPPPYRLGHGCECARLDSNQRKD